MSDAPPRPGWKRLLKGAGIAAAIGAALIFGRAYLRGTQTYPERTTAEGLTPGDVEARLIDRDGARWVQLSGVVESPIEHVWLVVHDHERMPEFMPRMARLKILEQKNGHRNVRIDFAFLGIERFTEIDVTREVRPEIRVERWEKYGGTLPVNHGRWVLVPLGPGRTFARYEVDVQSGLPVPYWMERAILLDALPVVLKRVRERIEELKVSDPAYLQRAQ